MKPRCVFLTSMLLPIAATCGAQGAPAKDAEFPIPAHILPLSEAVTPREYREAIHAIKVEMAKPEMKDMKDDEGTGLGDLDWISASKVSLGNLGTGLMIDFRHSSACGTGGCPMWLLLPRHDGYEVALAAGGWGYWLKSSGQSIPDVILYWQMGAGETDVVHFRYSGGKFRSVAAKPGTCGGEGSTDVGDCMGREAALHSTDGAIAPAEYKSLAEEVGAGSSPVFADRAHALDFQLVNNEVAQVVGVGDCTPDSNCVISIYACNQIYPKPGTVDPKKANLPSCQLWPLLTGVNGWGVANVSDWIRPSDPFAPRLAFVVARRLSGTKTEFVRYSAIVDPMGPKADTRLTRDSCEVVIANSASTDQSNHPFSSTHGEPCIDGIR